MLGALELWWRADSALRRGAGGELTPRPPASGPARPQPAQLGDQGCRKRGGFKELWLGGKDRKLLYGRGLQGSACTSYLWTNDIPEPISWAACSLKEQAVLSPLSSAPQLGDSAVWVTCLSSCLLTLQELAENPGPRGL